MILAKHTVLLDVFIYFKLWLTCFGTWPPGEIEIEYFKLAITTISTFCWNKQKPFVYTSCSCYVSSSQQLEQFFKTVEMFVGAFKTREFSNSWVFFRNNQSEHWSHASFPLFRDVCKINSITRLFYYFYPKH